MEVEILHTERCLLRPATIDDASWMYDLFNDQDVVEYIEGLKWFNTDVESVANFIENMQVNADKDLGAIWCVELDTENIGFIMAYDLKENPFLSFALFPQYRNQRLGTEVIKKVYDHITSKYQSPKIETKNQIVKKIQRKLPPILFINGDFHHSLESLRRILDEIDLRKDSDSSLMDSLVAFFRDGNLLSWLEYLSENGDGEAFDIATSIRNIRDNEGEKAIKRGLFNLLRTKSIDDPSLANTMPVRLIDDAVIDSEDGVKSVNPYLPIRLNQSGQVVTITLKFEILDVCNDDAIVTLANESRKLSLKSKKKSHNLTFPIPSEEKKEQKLSLKVDETEILTIVIQSYPPQVWSERMCCKQGIRHLYMQEYTDARLCFERINDTAAGNFWLAMMHYIGAGVELDAKSCLNLLEKAKRSRDGLLGEESADLFDGRGYSVIAYQFMAIMAMKGEGKTIDFLTEYKDWYTGRYTGRSSYYESLFFLRDAIDGRLDSEDCDKILYSYNMADNEVEPKVSITISNRVFNGECHWNNETGKLIIRFHKEWSDLKRFKGSDIHAHIGFKIDGKEWRWTLEYDWNDNIARNTFVTDSNDSDWWKLEIENVRITYNIPKTEVVQQVNFILRDDTGEIKLEPEPGKCFIIDSLASRSHRALCNLTPLLCKLHNRDQIINEIGYRYI